MLKVKFNEPEEFTEELQKVFASPVSMFPTEVLRCTQVLTATPMGTIQRCEVVATVPVRETPFAEVLLELRHYVGDYWAGPGGEEMNDKTKGRAAKVYGLISAAAKACRLDVRAGVYDLVESKHSTERDDPPRM